MEETFVTEVEVSAPDIHRGKAKLKWCFAVEMRDWGVKGLCVYVPDQTITVTYECEDADGDSVSITKSIELKDVDVDSRGVSFDGTVSPEELEIYEKSMAVNF